MIENNFIDYFILMCGIKIKEIISSRLTMKGGVTTLFFTQSTQRKALSTQSLNTC